jgi:hypothetical protein
VITDIIVFSAVAFAAAFFMAWLARPELRAWIERPKYGFQANVQHYDHSRRKGGNPNGGTGLAK